MKQRYRQIFFVYPLFVFKLDHTVIYKNKF